MTMTLSKAQADALVGQLCYLRMVINGPEMFGTIVEIQTEAEGDIPPFICFGWGDSEPQCFSLDSMLYVSRKPNGVDPFLVGDPEDEDDLPPAAVTPVAVNPDAEELTRGPVKPTGRLAPARR